MTQNEVNDGSWDADSSDADEGQGKSGLCLEDRGGQSTADVSVSQWLRFASWSFWLRLC